MIRVQTYEARAASVVNSMVKGIRVYPDVVAHRRRTRSQGIVTATFLQAAYLERCIPSLFLRKPPVVTTAPWAT